MRIPQAPPMPPKKTGRRTSSIMSLLQRWEAFKKNSLPGVTDKTVMTMVAVSYFSGAQDVMQMQLEIGEPQVTEEQAMQVLSKLYSDITSEMTRLKGQAETVKELMTTAEKRRH